jgi:hypothetical protein
MSLAIIEARLRTIHNLSESFRFFRWECLPKFMPTLYVELEGGECPLKTRGKNKGCPDFSKLQFRTTFTVTAVEVSQWEAEYERETGNCKKCCGSGKAAASYSVVSGMTYRDCCRCQGSGAAPQREVQSLS